MKLLDHPYYQLDWMGMDKAERRQRSELARQWAMDMIKLGDRITVARCGGRSTFTMAGWDGHWMVSRSGWNDLAPICVLRINGRHVVNPGLL